MKLDRVVSSVLLALMLSSTATAQATLTGLVRDDATLKPMKDVEIAIECGGSASSCGALVLWQRR